MEIHLIDGNLITNRGYVKVGDEPFTEGEMMLTDSGHFIQVEKTEPLAFSEMVFEDEEWFFA